MEQSVATPPTAAALSSWTNLSCRRAARRTALLAAAFHVAGVSAGAQHTLAGGTTSVQKPARCGDRRLRLVLSRSRPICRYREATTRTGHFGRGCAGPFLP